MSDAVNPDHYKRLPAEAIFIIESAIDSAPSNQDAYLHGQVIKYILRCWAKNGIEDLKKAKWYLDRLIDSFDEDEQQEAAEPQSLAAMPIDDRRNSDKIPEGYRKLKDSSVELRKLGDLRWSISQKRYVEIGEEEIGYANRDNWAACRKIEEPNKRYREPTLEDLKNGPIDCEVRNSYGEPWVWRILCYIADGSDRPFRVLKDRLKDSKAKWPHCRIEVTE